jgi:hypothetical protein
MEDLACQILINAHPGIRRAIRISKDPVFAYKNGISYWEKKEPYFSFSSEAVNLLSALCVRPERFILLPQGAGSILRRACSF